ncbi:MAG: hypothetical protein R3F39_21340 [Myxococcota bacterium]
MSALNLDLGHTVVGAVSERKLRLTNCGTNDELVVTQAELSPDSSAAFSLDFTGLEATGPLFVLAPGFTATLPVRYQPTSLSEIGADGLLVRERGAIRIASSATAEAVEVQLSGTGVATACPTAILSVVEGEEVIPQTRLHLRASDSLPPNGIKRVEWSAVQPDGSGSVFLPNVLATDPTFEANVVGEYVFRLKVTDAADTASCETAEVHVFVIPDAAIHVEMVWNTPGDPNQSDEGPEAGADLDLHFAHPLATGVDGVLDGWFDKRFDCFWFNAHPDWGSESPDVHDNPGLDRDDTDGTGPEIVNLRLPEDGQTYRIGIHSWFAHGFGPSWAKVRVFSYDELRFESATVKLQEFDFWEVATVTWPSATVAAIKGPAAGHKVIPNYKAVGFPVP